MAPSRKIQPQSKPKGGRSRKIDLVRMIKAASRLHGTSQLGRRVACCPDFDYSRRFNRNLTQVHRMSRQHPKKVFVIHRNYRFTRIPSTTNSTWARRPPPTGTSLPWILRYQSDSMEAGVDGESFPRILSPTYSERVSKVIKTADSRQCHMH